MEKAIQVLNQMLADGVVEKFAIGGGIAAIYYLEPYQTDDIDVFVLPIVVGQGGLVSLEPIYTYLEKLGYHSVEEGVGILIEGWTVQFVPAFKSVQEEAVTQAERVAYGQTHTLIFSAEHLAAELLRSARPKDHARVLDLIQSEQVDLKVFREIITRHDLADGWKEFAARYDLEE
jgi:hypothetical protein